MIIQLPPWSSSQMPIRLTSNIGEAMDSSNAATFCDGCDQLTAGREACAGPTRLGAVVP